jgi:hypothetical protein
MSGTAWLLNTAWMLRCSWEAAAFESACRRVAEAQERVLRLTVRANRDSHFGRAHGFSHVRDVREFQERVPLAAHEDFAADISRIAAGEANVLTSEPVRLLEPTSGTTGGEKLIPYTAGLRRQFQRGVRAWIADLFRRRPALRGGRAYWSISPTLGRPRRSPGGLPIGFDDDAAYLGWAEQFALRRLLVAPPRAAHMADMDRFRYDTLLSLLAAEDLTLISVWSPTFLTTLLSSLTNWQERLCFDLPRARRIPTRANQLTRVLGSAMPWADRLRCIWPRLALISCWADAAAGWFLPELRAWFGDVEVQPKGLLATEGFVSLPLIDRPGAALAVRCHFFEFQEAGGTHCRLAHELDRGGRYRVVLTTAGGLYRYQLHDEVEVVGFHHQCPLLRFVGKSDAISDLVGEKLSEPHVRRVLDQLSAAHDLRPRFALLVPVLGRPARYRLYLQGPGLDVGPSLQTLLRGDLDAGLAENPYYRHALASGQLAPAEVAILDPEGDPAWQLYERRCLAEGQKCGNIKPQALDRRQGWPEVFAPREAEPASGRR